MCSATIILFPLHHLLRLPKRNNGQPTDRIFPNDQHVLSNNILEEELKFDREGQRRTACSLGTPTSAFD